MLLTVVRHDQGCRSTTSANKIDNTSSKRTRQNLDNKIQPFRIENTCPWNLCTGHHTLRLACIRPQSSCPALGTSRTKTLLRVLMLFHRRVGQALYQVDGARKQRTRQSRKQYRDCDTP